MVPKKVGTLLLPYQDAEGNEQYDNFDAELVNATFNGDVSAMEGTFSGTLTADAVDVVKNITIAGRAVARTWLMDVPQKSGFDDDGVYRSLYSLTCEIPMGEHGNMLYTAQYDIDDARRDNDYFPCQWRLVINGSILFESVIEEFGYYYVHENRMIHIVSIPMNAGINTIDLQWRWFDYSTNVYPVFKNGLVRADFIKK